MPDNQHRKLYSKTNHPRQANLHYAECGRACARCVCKQTCSFLSNKKEIKEIRLNKERHTGHRKLYSKTISSIEYYTSITGATHLLGRTQNLLSLAKSASRLLLMRSSLMPLQQAAALGIMQVCLPWIICRAIKLSVLIIWHSLNLVIFFMYFLCR